MPDQPLNEGITESAPPAETEPAGVAVAEGQAALESGEDKPKPLTQTVEIKDVGPCKKHIKVAIAREDIDQRLNERFSEMMGDSFVPGYRPGKAPRKLVEKRYGKEVSEQLKAQLLLQSLEQLAEDYKLNPIAQPNLDPFKVELPKSGPLEYEFDIEVAPEFELPEYKGIRLKRPVREISKEDVEKGMARFLRSYGKQVPKDGPAALGDVLVTDIHFEFKGKAISDAKGVQVQLDPQLTFKDGVVPDFGKQMVGVKASEARQVTVHLAPNLSDESLRGSKVEAEFRVKQVLAIELPEVTDEFCHGLGLMSAESLETAIRLALERQLQYEQRRAARAQFLQMVGAASSWELPRDLVARQARRSLQRKLLEMESAGFTDQEIQSQARLLQQDAYASTERALKEHFVLQKIAEVEKLEVNEDDIETEIETLAEQTGESPRRVRARLEKEDLLESLMTQILERKALDLVLQHASYEDVPYEPADAVSSVDEQAVPSASVGIPETEEPPAAEGESRP